MANSRGRTSSACLGAGRTIDEQELFARLDAIRDGEVNALRRLGRIRAAVLDAVLGPAYLNTFYSDGVEERVVGLVERYLSQCTRLLDGVTILDDGNN